MEIVERWIFFIPSTVQSTKCRLKTRCVWPLLLAAVFWLVWYELYNSPIALNDGEKVFIRTSPALTTMLDFQDMHMTVAKPLPSYGYRVDSGASKTFQDASVLAFPGGLDQINQ
jgi:hypothetical protein